MLNTTSNISTAALLSRILLVTRLMKRFQALTLIDRFKKLQKDGKHAEIVKSFLRFRGNGSYMPRTTRVHELAISSARRSNDVIGAIELFEDLVKTCNTNLEGPSVDILYTFSDADQPKSAYLFLKKFESYNLVPTIQAYNAVIYGYSRAGDFRMVKLLLSEMSTVGVKFDASTLKEIIRGKKWSKHQISWFLFQLRLPDHELTVEWCMAALRAFRDIHNLTGCIDLYNDMKRLDLLEAHSFTTIINTVCDANDIKLARDILDESYEITGKVLPDCYVNVMERAGKHMRLDYVMEILQEFNVRNNDELNKKFLSSFIRACGHCGRFDLALAEYNRRNLKKSKNAALNMVLIKSAGCWKDSLLFAELFCESQFWAEIKFHFYGILGALMRSCAEHGRVDSMISLLRTYEVLGLTTGMYAATFEGLSKSEHWNIILTLFKKYQLDFPGAPPSLPIFHAVMRAGLELGKWRIVLWCIDELRRLKAGPILLTYRMALEACDMGEQRELAVTLVKELTWVLEEEEIQNLLAKYSL